MTLEKAIHRLKWAWFQLGKCMYSDSPYYHARIPMLQTVIDKREAKVAELLSEFAIRT